MLRAPVLRVPLRPRRAALAGLALAGGLAALLTLVWHDVLPGAWTLHGWVEGREGRAAWLRRRAAAQRLALFRAENPSVPPGRVLFLGSSTIERWPLERELPGAPVLNRGLNGDTTAELLARLDASWPAGRPAGAVVQIGANDLWREGAAPEAVAAGVAAVLDALAARLGDAPVALLGLFPTRETGPAERARLEATNARLAQLAAARGAAFVPTDRPPLADAEGRLAAALAADPHHLGSAGYSSMTGWLLAEGGAVADLLKP